jgi:toxin ParE1/3/4
MMGWSWIDWSSKREPPTISCPGPGIASLRRCTAGPRQKIAKTNPCKVEWTRLAALVQLCVRGGPRRRYPRSSTSLTVSTNFISEQSVESALNFVRELRENVSLWRMRRAAIRWYPRHEHLGIRRRPFGNYLIFYRVAADAIEVVHILHGARDYEPLLFPER